MFTHPGRLCSIVAALVVAFVLGAGTPAADAANIVANGGFETGAFGPQWTLAPGGPFDQVCQAGNPIGAATCIANTGQFSMSFGLNGANDTFTQVLPTVAGQTYDLSFFLANDNPSGAGTETFSAFWDGVQIFSLASPQLSFGFTQELFLNLTATTGATPLVFVARHDPSQWFLDDVSVQTTVPEPATLTLLGVGLAGLAARKRRGRIQG